MKTTPTTLLLVIASVLNAFYLFTRIKVYRLHQRTDPIASPNAKYVSAQLDFEPLQTPSLVSRVASGSWYLFSASWRFLLNMKPATKSGSKGPKMSKVQQIDMWLPGPLESTLFSIYSPAHSLLWMATTSANWMLMFIIMAGVGVQVRSCMSQWTKPLTSSIVTSVDLFI